MAVNISPNRSFIPGNNSFALEKSLIYQKNRRDVKKHAFWSAVNIVMFTVLFYDLYNSCPFYYNYYDYAEYAVLLVITCNLIYFGGRLLVLSLDKLQIPITLEQKQLLGINDSDVHFKVVESLNHSNIQTPQQSFFSSSLNSSSPLSSTQMNSTAYSWRSISSDGYNYSQSSPSWSYHRAKPDLNSSQFSPDRSFISNINYMDTSGIDFITDETDLERYLKEFDVNTKVQNLSTQNQQPSNLLSSFWSHPVTKTAKDMSTFLKRCTYQMSTQSPGSSSPKSKIENKSSQSSPQNSAMLVWARLNVDIVTLTQWNENLRKWISQTILERLVNEFDTVNESLERHGLPDIKIGAVGLERLRKTGQISHVANFIPSLSSLIPFLEATPNQDYLEKRIRQLARGGCMSEFKWNGGSSYNGKEWDESLPTDSAIIMHLLASYLDTQLMPLPSMPDMRPFSGYYYIKSKDKMPILTPSSIFIQQVSDKPAHFRVIVGESIYEMVKGYNNLFHSILFFLYHVNQKEHGMLGRVNLGRAGVNMLWIIEK